MEIMVTFPMEYVKTQVSEPRVNISGRMLATAVTGATMLSSGPLCALRSQQLQQEASTLSPVLNVQVSRHCATDTVRKMASLIVSRWRFWILFAAPRSAVRFGAFEALSEHRGALSFRIALANRLWTW